MPFDVPAYLRLWRGRLDRLTRRPVALAAGLGLILRIALYLNNRGLWLDEVSLQDNIARRPASELFAPYAHSQLAPPGFLAVEWVVGRVFGPGPMALRFVPLLAGLAGVAGFALLAKRVMSPRGAWVATLLYAVCGDLIVYSSELKPYSVDVAAAVACVLAGVAVGSGSGSSVWRYAGFAGLGAGLVWLSFPAALVLAGVGSSLIVAALVRRQWRAAAALGLTALVWGASFAAEHQLAVRMLGDGRGAMHTFWEFAFPPWPPGTWRDVLWPLRRGLYLFVNPLDYYHGWRFSLWATALPAVACFVVGAVSLWRRDRLLCGMLGLPWVLAVGAAYARLYPFHGRLVLFLAPALLLTIAEGLAVGLGVLRSGWARALLLAAVLWLPALRVLHHVAEPRLLIEHNGIGDIRPRSVHPERFPF